MLKRVFSGILLTLLLVLVVASAVNIQLVKAEPRTWIVDKDGPADFRWIQDAINAAGSGDTIFVRAGTYYESLVINKAVSLVGEQKETTIIDGLGVSGSIIYVRSDNVTINSFTVRNSAPDYFGIYWHQSNYGNIFGNIIEQNTYGLWICNGCMNNVSNNTVTQNVYGIWLALESNSNNITGNIVANTTNIYRGRGIYLVSYCSSNNIEGNTVTNHLTGILLDDECGGNTINRNTVTNNNASGIYVLRSSFNTITENTVTDNHYGITITRANIMRDNNMSGNCYNLGIGATHLSDLINTCVDTSNTVNGKPVYYWTYEHDKRVPDDAGYVAIISSINVTVESLMLADNDVGVLFAYTSDSIIRDVNAYNNIYGIRLLHCNNCTIIGNNIKNNTEIRHDVPNLGCGICLEYSCDNVICHNNFENVEQIYVSKSFNNSWDDGYPSGGNYWSDYFGLDNCRGPYQNGTGSDGIGDTPYAIDLYNIDPYPLLDPWSLLPGDVNRDGEVDGKDLAVVAKAFDSHPESLRWNPLTDLNHDSKIDGKDLTLVAKSLGKTYV